jgi:hypothetical protein
MKRKEYLWGCIANKNFSSFYFVLGFDTFLKKCIKIRVQQEISKEISVARQKLDIV